MKRKIIACIFIICFAFTASLGRIGYIIFSQSYNVSDSYNSYTVTLDADEVNLYYRDMSRLTNNVSKKVCVIRPVEKNIKEVYKKFSPQEQKYIFNELKNNKPAVIEVDDDFKSGNLPVYLVNDTENNCSQLVSKKSSGLLKHIPDSKRSLKVNYSVDAKGRFLNGDSGTVKNSDYFSYKGLKLSIDKNIQNITYDSSKSLKTGCVIVMDVKSKEILSCVTKPDNCCINKAFARYSVGSVFKIVTSLCALENNYNAVYDCSGSIKVGDTVFSCQNNKKHSKQNLKEALANSCNCYFVNAALSLGPEKILATAKALGFDDSTCLYNGWNIKNASLPKLSSIKTKGKTALLGFGQGKLTSTPLQICSMMSTVADYGVISEPVLVTDEIDENKNKTNICTGKVKHCASAKDAKMLLSYLRYVVANGTGKNADFNSSSAGKTATAQTGQFKNNKEILNTWFAGVYPWQNPKYAIVVMCDNGTSGSQNCCPVFSTIVEKLENL